MSKNFLDPVLKKDRAAGRMSIRVKLETQSSQNQNNFK
jgi:hypothetical protein